MATYYKYAERSAESQINWAEIGKNMTDMLQQEVAIREQKKAAIDEATRRYAEELSNAPQGEHIGAREEALRFADDASQYMLMQERLLKSGLMKPKDYLIARQNLVDGTKKAFGSIKAFQENYAKLMERAKTDTSSAIELKRLEKVQGYGNFRDSGFFIDAPSGNVNVALKDYQDIDGKKVIAMKQGSTRGMQYIDGAIYGQVDKFKYLDPLKALSDTYGEEIRSSIADPATMSKIGTIKSISDLRQRQDIDPATKKVLFHYMTAVTDSVNALMANPLQRGSLLIDTMGYEWTDDPAEAAKDPRKVLEVIDPNTGRGELKFTKEQEQASTDFMVQQFLGMVDRKEELKPMGQVQLQERRPPTQGEIDRDEKRKDAENFGRQLGTALKSGNDQEVGNAIKYLAQKSGRQVDRQGDKIIIRDINGQGESVFDLKAEPDKIAAAMVSAFGTNLPEDTILKFARDTFKGRATNTTTRAKGINVAEQPKKVDISLSSITQPSQKAIVTLQGELPSGFTVKEVGFNPFGNDIEITAPDGKTKYNFTSGKSATAAEIIQKDLVNWVTKNAGKGTKEL